MSNGGKWMHIGEVDKILPSDCWQPIIDVQHIVASRDL